jgi:hypothetical protein
VAEVVNAVALDVFKIDQAVVIGGLGVEGDAATVPAKFWIDDTLYIDPGSDAQQGALSGYVIDLGARGVRVAQPVHA